MSQSFVSSLPVLLGFHWLSLVFSVYVLSPFIWTALELISLHFSVDFSVFGELYSSSTDAFDLQLCVLSVWVCSVWWQTSDLDETTCRRHWKCTSNSVFVSNFELLTGHEGDLLCANLPDHSSWLCGFASVGNCCGLLIDWPFGCRTGGIFLLHPSPL